jgi:hypothetical protein
MYDKMDTAESVFVSGYAPDGQYYTGLPDQREPLEQRSTALNLSAADSAHEADLTALRAPQAPLELTLTHPSKALNHIHSSIKSIEFYKLIIISMFEMRR